VGRQIFESSPRASRHAASTGAGRGRPVRWPQEKLRRGAAALRECRSQDIFVIVSAVLESAIRTDADLPELLNDAPARQVKAAVAAVTHAAA
jgi:hypothetical protein